MKRRTNKEIEDRIKLYKVKLEAHKINEHFIEAERCHNAIIELEWTLGFCDKCGTNLTDEERKKKWCIKCHRDWMG